MADPTLLEEYFQIGRDPAGYMEWLHEQVHAARLAQQEARDALHHIKNVVIPDYGKRLNLAETAKYQAETKAEKAEVAQQEAERQLEKARDYIVGHGLGLP